MRLEIYLPCRWDLSIDFAAAAYLLCAIGVSNSLAKTFNWGAG